MGLRHDLSKLAKLATITGYMAAAGCSDPLVGTWSTTEPPGGSAPEGVTQYKLELTFNADRTWSQKSTAMYDPMAPTFAGCTVVAQTTGGMYTEGTEGGADTLTMTGTPMSTSQRTGCAQSTDNQPSPVSVDASASGAPAVMPGPQLDTYSIRDDSLTILTESSVGTPIALTRE